MSVRYSSESDKWDWCFSTSISHTEKLREKDIFHWPWSCVRHERCKDVVVWYNLKCRDRYLCCRLRTGQMHISLQDFYVVTLCQWIEFEGGGWDGIKWLNVCIIERSWFRRRSHTDEFSLGDRKSLFLTQVIAECVSALKQQLLPVVPCPAVKTRLVGNWSLLFRFRSIDGPICKLQA